MIGWEQDKYEGTNTIFGIPQAYVDCCEEQARYTLHSHITVWVENFNDIRNLLFHEDEEIKRRAIHEIEKYFNCIAQASLGDLY